MRSDIPLLLISSRTCPRLSSIITINFPKTYYVWNLFGYQLEACAYLGRYSILNVLSAWPWDNPKFWAMSTVHSSGLSHHLCEYFPAPLDHVFLAIRRCTTSSSPLFKIPKRLMYKLRVQVGGQEPSGSSYGRYIYISSVHI